MGEEMRRRDYGSVGDDEEQRVLEWEEGLPNADDLTPLSQHLISPLLASAFSIKAEPLQTMLDVQRASQKTLSTLRSRKRNLKSSFTEDQIHEELMIVEEDEEHGDDVDDDCPATSTKDGSETRKIRRVLLETNTEEAEADSSFRTENSAGDDDQSARTLKRPRLVWTPQLHKRFVDVVGHLGMKNSVPKTIMQLMNVEGLTRENVASHLQKYRLYLKRMQGLSNEGPSSSDPLFASTPVPHSLHEHPNSSTGKNIRQSQPSPPPQPMPYGGAPVLPMPILGHGFGGAGAGAAYKGFEFHPYGMFRDQQRDWPGNNRFGPMISYPKASK